MTNRRLLIRGFALAASLMVLTVGLAACTPSAAQEPAVTVTKDTILLDVRTAEEFAAGHLDGAIQIDFNAGDIARAIPDLDPNAEYLVYCRSGNRSGQAIEHMRREGFTNLTNLGSLEQASEATGIGIIAE